MTTIPDISKQNIRYLKRNRSLERRFHDWQTGWASTRKIVQIPSAPVNGIGCDDPFVIPSLGRWGRDPWGHWLARPTKLVCYGFSKDHASINRIEYNQSKHLYQSLVFTFLNTIYTCLHASEHTHTHTHNTHTRNTMKGQMHIEEYS